jgi:L-lactate dehydrogenase complex protein LldF
MSDLDSTIRQPPRVLHPEVVGDRFEGARDAEGRPLVHAEGTSKPIRARTPHEPQPRGARDRGNRPVDQIEASQRFIAATEHEKAHDERLWDMRLRRDKAAHALPEWEEMRSLASQIKEHALTHLDQYLEQFEAAAKANGVVVHWAADGAEHNRIVHEILKERNAKTLIKSKSMLTDECGFRPYMAGVGIEVIETDLGERIQQLDGEEPSHIIGPAIHKTRADVAGVFARTLGSDPNDDDILHLARVVDSRAVPGGEDNLLRRTRSSDGPRIVGGAQTAGSGGRRCRSRESDTGSRGKRLCALYRDRTQGQHPRLSVATSRRRAAREGDR